MNAPAILGIALFVAGFVVMATGRSPLIGLILVIVGGILARTGIKGAVGRKLHDNQRDEHSNRR